MDPTEHLPISPIYHVIWYNWCSMLWRSTGRAWLLVRVGIHRYRVLAFSACIMLGSNCSTPSLSCRNTNLYLIALKYFAVENEAWDRTRTDMKHHDRPPATTDQKLFSSWCLHFLHWKEDLAITSAWDQGLGPDSGHGKSKGKLPTMKEHRNQFGAKSSLVLPKPISWDCVGFSLSFWSLG